MIILDYRERKIIPLALEIDDVEIYNLPFGDMFTIFKYSILKQSMHCQNF